MIEEKEKLKQKEIHMVKAELFDILVEQEQLLAQVNNLNRKKSELLNQLKNL